LSTFDSAGRLGQVQHALRASTLGTPILAIATETDIVMASPEALPSPLIIRDGTSRFILVSKDIMVAHSGLSADGRLLAAAAQRLAVEHDYTFDESIPIEIFLQEMSLLMQEYTMKAAVRPFGACLLIGHNPLSNKIVSMGKSTRKPTLYRIDPSGAITSRQYFALNDMIEQRVLPAAVEAIRNLPTDEVAKGTAQALQNQLAELEKRTTVSVEEPYLGAVESMLVATLGSGYTFRIERYAASDTLSD
jgi:20S proteasome alpha/beta subunit